MTTATLKTCHAALVPAKQRSSRCPGKNWRPFVSGHSLTEWVLASLPPELFSNVILSTDRQDYAPARPCRVHRRQAAQATVEADIQDLVRVIIEEYGLHDAYVWLLNPTSPFRDVEDFHGIAQLIERTDCPAVISVTPVGQYLWHGDRPMFATTGRRRNTQDLPQAYYAENGMFYVFRAAEFLDAGTWYLPGARCYVQHGLRKTVDIDTPEQFCEAQILGAAFNRPDDRPPGMDETLAIERLIAPPTGPNLVLLANHVGRYALAAEALDIGQDHLVLDASCGKGYGSFLLARMAGRVIGLDVNREYLEVARREFAADNLSFISYDDYFSSPREPVDKLVCIETYEHLPKQELPAFLGRLFGALRPGGDAFVTCPVGEDRPSEVNAFHLNEPSLAALDRWLVQWFRQSSLRIARRTDSFGHVAEYCCATLTGYRGAFNA